MRRSGWHQYVAYAVPKPAIGDFNEKAEIEASLQDLRDLFPAFADAKMLSIRVMRDSWPAQRACAGFDLPQETPLANVWHVGDAVKDYGDGGTQACAFTAREAVNKASALLARGGSMSDLRRLNTPPQRAGLIETSAGCLKTLRACLDATTADRARACAADARGFGAGIERRQIAAFELAWAAADAPAAETAVRAIGPDARSLDAASACRSRLMRSSR